jgi:threonine 3-dehydrogenase
MVSSKKMRALAKPFGQHGLRLVENLEIPTCGQEDVLIKVITSSVCGTDLHIYKSDPSIADRVADNQIIGHEFCGEVIEVGARVKTHQIGDIVASESHIIDNTCFQCLNGQKHLCQNISLIGIDRPGGLAQYVAIPSTNAIIMTEDINDGEISHEIASFMDAYGNAVDTATTVPLTAKSVLVTGTGPQGLMAIAVALASGAKQVIATEVAEKRLAMAEEIIKTHAPGKSRNDLVLNAKDPQLHSKIKQATRDIGVDVLLEMSGHSQAINDGLASLRNGGHAVILGVSSGGIELDWPSLIFKGITMHFRYGRKLNQTWTDGRRLLQSGSVKLESLIHDKSFQLDEFEEAFELLLSGEAAKIIFRPNG